ncbi:hypothetical protein SUGI_0289020 [Cryptomeria japonica]|nr:hypothetical protein SUGI_0289020 [Cryptomeria japonica]
MISIGNFEMGSSKWRRARDLLGKHLCMVVHPENEDPSYEIVPSRSSSLCLVGESNPGPSKSSPRQLSKLGARSSRSTCAICLEAIKPVCRAKWNEVPLLGPPTVQALPPRIRRLNSSSWSQEMQSPRLLRHGLLLHSSVQEPSVFDDDEPLAQAQRSPHEIRQKNSYGHTKSSANAGEEVTGTLDSIDGGTHEVIASMYSSVKSNMSVGMKDEPEALFVEILPELAAVPRSEVWDKFTVLLHLKAPSSIAIQQNDNQICEEGVQSGTAHEIELGTQNHTHSSEGIMRSPLQACDATTDRSPIDLVTVLDVSGSMSGTKLVLLKRAMGFVIQNLCPADRLAIVVFSSTAKRLFPLRHMTQEGRQQALQAVDLLVSTGGTNIAEGLRKGSKVLEDRRERNTVSSIMLLSDGQDTHNIGNHWEVTYTNSRRASDYHCLLPGSIRHASQHGFTSIPVHTFGFGSDHDATAMHSIAEASGGTFSFIETESFIQDAFAQCIGGLLSVMIQDVQVAITSSNPDVQLVAIQAGGYASNITDEGQQGFIKIGDLYAEEERDFLIDVKLPALLSSIDGSSCNGMKVINVVCTYRDPVSQKTFQTMVNELVIERPESISMEQQSVCLEVDRQRNRLSAANTIADARACADRGDLSRAQLILGTTRTALQMSRASQAGDQLCKSLESELAEIQERMANAQLYENSGRAYVLSAHISHSRQRATTRGNSNDGLTTVGDYKTSKMLDMLMRSQTMCPPAQVAASRTLLPSKTFPLPESRSSR